MYLHSAVKIKWYQDTMYKNYLKIQMFIIQKKSYFLKFWVIFCNCDSQSLFFFCSVKLNKVSHKAGHIVLLKICFEGLIYSGISGGLWTLFFIIEHFNREGGLVEFQISKLKMKIYGK